MFDLFMLLTFIAVPVLVVRGFLRASKRTRRAVLVAALGVAAGDGHRTRR